MILLTKEEIIRIHQTLIDRTGGVSGLRDEGLLESSVYSTEGSFEGHELYPSVKEKAARLCFSLICNPAFFDGNKRLGILAMLLSLRLYSVPLQYSQTDLIRLGLGVAKGETSCEEILSWIGKHSR